MPALLGLNLTEWKKSLPCGALIMILDMTTSGEALLVRTLHTRCCVLYVCYGMYIPVIHCGIYIIQ